MVAVGTAAGGAAGLAAGAPPAGGLLFGGGGTIRRVNCRGDWPERFKVTTRKTKAPFTKALFIGEPTVPQSRDAGKVKEECALGWMGLSEALSSKFKA